jgi:hypothetical protein
MLIEIATHMPSSGMFDELDFDEPERVFARVAGVVLPPGLAKTGDALLQFRGGFSCVGDDARQAVGQRHNCVSY